MEEILAKAIADPNIDPNKKDVLERQLRNSAAANRAAFERKMPIFPDMRSLDEVIKRVENMVQNLGNSTPFFNDNNLFWIEFSH